jgi:LCP family protein required for cell wall assembly
MSSSPTTPLPPRSERRKLSTSVKRKRTINKTLKFVGIPIGLILIAVLIFIVMTWRNAEETLEKIGGGVDIVVPKEELAKEKPITILLLGLDARPKIGTLNTDVIMIASLNPEDKSAVLVSVPRDTYVKVDGWSARKANSFYAALYNENKETVLSEIKPIFSEFIGVPIDYVTVVDFQTFEDIVDELGGITVEVDQDMYYVDPTDGTHIDLKAGVQKLNGDQALDFVRYRQSTGGRTPESSDLQRNVRQQKVVAAILQRLKSFNAILKINGILNAIGENIRTDIPSQQLKSLITTYATISGDKITYIPLEGVWRSPYVYLNEDKFAEARAALRRQLNLADSGFVYRASGGSADPGKSAAAAPQGGGSRQGGGAASAGNGGKAQGGGAASAGNGGKAQGGGAAPQGAGETAQGAGQTPQGAGETAQGAGQTPQEAGETAQGGEEAPQGAGDAAQGAGGELLQGAGDAAQGVGGEASQGAGETAQGGEEAPWGAGDTAQGAGGESLQGAGDTAQGAGGEASQGSVDTAQGAGEAN